MPAPSSLLRPLTPTLAAAIGLSLLLWGLFAAGGWWAVTRVHALPSLVLPAVRTVQPTALPPEPPIVFPTHASDESGPPWVTLSTAQQEALAPLKPHWSTLTEAQKHRWMSLAANFHKLSSANREKMQERMTAWANLTPQQRSRARLNYAATQKIAPPAKQEQWEAYQALSQDKKKEYADRAAPAPQGAAIAVHPVPARKFARVPAATGAAGNPNPPKILPPVVDLTPVPVPPQTAPPPAVVETAPIPTPSAAPAPLPPLSAAPAEPAEPAAAPTDPADPPL